MLQNRPLASSLGAAQHLVPRHDDVEIIAAAEAEELSGAPRIGDSAEGRRQPEKGELFDNSLVNCDVQLSRLTGARMAGGNGAGVGPFVVMEDRAAPRQSSDHRQLGEPGVAAGVLGTLKVPDREGGLVPAIPADAAWSAGDRRLKQGLVDGHIPCTGGWLSIDDQPAG